MKNNGELKWLSGHISIELHDRMASLVSMMRTFLRLQQCSGARQPRVQGDGRGRAGSMASLYGDGIGWVVGSRLSRLAVGRGGRP